MEALCAEADNSDDVTGSKTSEDPVIEVSDEGALSKESVKGDCVVEADTFVNV